MHITAELSDRTSCCISLTAGMSTSGGIEFVAKEILDCNGSGGPRCLAHRKKGYIHRLESLKLIKKKHSRPDINY